MKLLAICLLILGAVPVAAQTAEPEHVSSAGVKYYAQPDTTGAVAEAEQKLAADPKNIDLILVLGRAQGGIWRFRAAIATYTRGLELAPNEARLLVARGHRYISLRQPDKALTDLQKAARIDPAAAGLWYHLGLAHYLRGEFVKAAAAFEKSRAEAKTDAELMGPSDWLYMSLRRAGKNAEAAKVLERISPETKIEGNENLYFSRLLLYKGVKSEADLPLPAPSDDMASELRVATLGYGVGNWHLYNGNAATAREYFERAVASKAWAAFGFICAEKDLTRLPPRPALMAQAEMDQRWMEKNFVAALDQLMPMNNISGTWIAYRSYQDYRTFDLEYSFLFDDSPTDEEIEVMIRVADRTSIYRQLSQLHMRNRRASLEDLLPKINVKKWQFIAGTCSAVSPALARLSQLTFQLPPNKEIVIHSRVHEFNFNRFEGDIEIVHHHPEHPLIQWAWETKAALETCTGETVELGRPR